MPQPPNPYRAHPWHGIASKEGEYFYAYIELVPTDMVKYEMDKRTGILKVDRPQKYSSRCPTLYGFIPRTYCGKRVGEYASAKLARPGLEGDGDPMDICVLSNKPITHRDLLVLARPIGGFRMLDGGQADDKIIAVLRGDSLFGGMTAVDHLPKGLLDELVHYFLTYKQLPDESERRVELAGTYSASEALEVIECSIKDYIDHFSAGGEPA